LSIYPVIADRRSFSREVHPPCRAQPNAHALVGETPRDAAAHAAERQPREALVRQHGMRLRIAVDDRLCDIGHHHLGVDDSPARILDALARDHLRGAEVKSM